MNIVTLLENLITKRFYKNQEDIENKLTIFFAMDKINDTDYSNLVLKTREVYQPTTETEPKTEPEIAEDKPVEETTESEE